MLWEISPWTWQRNLCCTLFCWFSTALVLHQISVPWLILKETRSRKFFCFYSKFRRSFWGMETWVRLLCPGWRGWGAYDCASAWWRGGLRGSSSLKAAMCQLRGVPKGTRHQGRPLLLHLPCLGAARRCCQSVTSCQEGAGLGDPSNRACTSSCCARASGQRGGCQPSELPFGV